jgi:hypothetical protein
MTTPTTTTDQAQPTSVDSEWGMLVAVLLMVVLGTLAVVVMLG